MLLVVAQPVRLMKAFHHLMLCGALAMSLNLTGCVIDDGHPMAAMMKRGMTMTIAVTTNVLSDAIAMIAAPLANPAWSVAIAE